MATPTQLMAFSNEPCTPYIPPELVYHILEHLWEEPCTSQSRAALLKNIVLVNRTWLALAARIASHDAYPYCHHNPSTFLRLITKLSSSKDNHDLFYTEIAHVATQFCRSLTFDLDKSLQGHHLNKEGLIDIVVPLALLLPSAPHYLQNLRKISLLCTDWDHNDIFQHIRRWGFPPQATHLSLSYAFTGVWEGMSDQRGLDVANALTWIYHPDPGPSPAFLPGLRHLALSGVPKPFPVLMLKHVCPHVETLELTHPAAGQLPPLAPLPPSTRTLVLRYPGVALSKMQIAAWELPNALEKNLFPQSGAGMNTLKLKTARIVVYSGTPDHMAFTELQRECARFNVELVHERDDSRGWVVPGACREAECAYKEPSATVAYIRRWMQSCRRHCAEDDTAVSRLEGYLSTL